MNESANGDDQSVLSKPLVRYALIWGIWTIVALFFSTQLYLMNYAEKQSIIAFLKTLSDKDFVTNPKFSE